MLDKIRLKQSRCWEGKCCRHIVAPSVASDVIGLLLTYATVAHRLLTHHTKNIQAVIRE